MITSYWPLAFGLLLVAGFGSWVFIHSNRSYLLRWAMIPLSLAVAVASAKVYDTRLGYAVAAELPKRFVYLGHQVVVEDKHKTGIEVWAQVTENRVYRIPYSKPMEEALELAREQAKGGLPVVMSKRASGDKSGKGGTLADAGIVPYDSNIVLPSQLDPKNEAAGPA
jgi:hypothetical protein